jgi:phosphoribosyl 1,2-cyclic phosphodiesterase
MAFAVSANGLKAGLLTDLGYIPESVKFHLRGCNFLLLEANHDVEMLKVGPYPWSVKQRVMGRHGHLSNDRAAEFARENFDGELQTIVLGHLSENNNHPSLAQIAVQSALDATLFRPSIEVAAPKEVSREFVVRD